MSVTSEAAEALREAFLSSPPLHDLFGITALEWGPGTMTLALDHRPELGHAPGWFQGAVTTAIAEYASAIPAGLMAADRDSMTVQQNIHFTGPAHGERLIAVGRVISAGSSISTATSEVFVERDGKRHPCATMTATIAHRPRRGQ